MKQHLIGAVIGAVLTHGAYSILDNTSSDAYHDLVAQIKKDEGFRQHIYEDSRGFRSIGYGTNLELGISPDEGQQLLNSRIQRNGKELEAKWPPFKHLPAKAQELLIEMSYQLGPDGVLKFKKMLDDLEKGDYKSAAAEAKKSEWAKQTPKRAQHASDVLELLSGE